MYRRLWVGGVLVLAGLVPGFLGGVVTGKTLFATSVNVGLVNAFSSVGQNLLGDAAFGASAIPGNPVVPSGAVQVDVSTDTQIPVAMSLFKPPNPNIAGDSCKRAAQLSIVNGQPLLTIDSTIFNSDTLQINYGSIPGNPIVPDACPSQIIN